VLVYVGAVAILIVFAILLTRGSGPPEPSVFSQAGSVGLAIAVVVFAVLTEWVLSSKGIAREVPPVPAATFAKLATN